MRFFLTISTIAFGLGAAGFAFLPSLSTHIMQNKGIFDPTGASASSTSNHYELLYASWSNNVSPLHTQVKNSIDKKRIPVITIEPWPLQEYNDTHVLASTAQGRYNHVIDTTCSDLKTFDTDIIIRWGHEMEINSTRYPWSKGNTQEYINAYRVFVTRCKTYDTHNHLFFMWSPSGEAGSELYWPGKDFVDIIGVSVYSFDKWDEQNSGHKRTFEEIFAGKYNRLKKFGKPIMIAEMGVNGTSDYQQQWLQAMRVAAPHYSKLLGYIYFNSKDIEGAWGPSYPTPDWTITNW
jgi:cellulose synthase (UDP-forming)